MMLFEKKLPVISYTDFTEKARSVTSYTSSSGKRYKVMGFEGDVMLICRLDASSNMNWEIPLWKVYEAYVQLDDFSTKSFKQYLPRRQSPSRGLLLHLQLLS
ncbi:hypothetical protein HQ865_11150 [Mucilaginibacter mali]|uniref:Uncharacterized protein n=1 Tax=Mucilaginibacter mali TaxID=2740462 RepID=A0A7D4TV58_9SPHI|nr:hypothetical protein [Mucilaginibacter mali]QKJ30295.1 hypothetical protein HQ865_11150 [Mucilaginibacter mali]